DIGLIDGRGLVGVLQNLMFSVAVGAEGRLCDSLGQRLAVDAGPILVDDFGVAHTAGIGHRATKRSGFGRQKLMGATVAQPAIGCGGVTSVAGLAVDAAGIVAGLVGVARRALRFGNAGRVRKRFVTVVAGIASQTGVRTFFELLALFMTGDALGGFGRIGGR